jgi:DNA/RNA-binding domain of Phe-tRNA-synthetase-like protein
MCTKKEWRQAAERRLTENLTLLVLIEELEQILSKPVDDLPQAKKRIRRALRKIAVAKEVRNT